MRTRTYGGAGGGAGDDPDYPIAALLQGCGPGKDTGVSAANNTAN